MKEEQSGPEDRVSEGGPGGGACGAEGAEGAGERRRGGEARAEAAAGAAAERRGDLGPQGKGESDEADGGPSAEGGGMAERPRQSPRTAEGGEDGGKGAGRRESGAGPSRESKESGPHVGSEAGGRAGGFFDWDEGEPPGERARRWFEGSAAEREEPQEPEEEARGFGRRKGWRKSSAGEGTFARGRGFVEGMVPDVLKRLFVAGVGTLATGEEGVRRVANEFSLPKEAVSYLLVQVQSTKKELFRIVANEIRDFLENVNLGAEIQKILTSLTFEVKMQIRLKPSEKDNSVRPDIRGGVSVKPDSSKGEKKRSRKR